MHDIKMKVDSDSVSPLPSKWHGWRVPGVEKNSRSIFRIQVEWKWDCLCVSCKARRNQATWPQARVILDTLYIMSCPGLRFHFTGHWLLPALDCLLVSIILGIRLKLGALDLSRDVRMFTTREKIINLILSQDGTLSIDLSWSQFSGWSDKDTLDRITTRIWRQKV